MQKTFTAIIIFVVGFTLTVSASDVKRGWNIGPLPAIGYISDLGFQYGVLCDFYYYGDGSSFPQYIHKFNFQVSQYTKGSGIFHFFYDSKFLIPSLRVTFAASYLPDKMKSFYGFNGFSSPYNDEYSKAFYAIDRNLTRIMANFQGNLSGNINWVAGLSFFNYNISRAEDDIDPDLPTLYDHYVNEGVIRPEEAKGGALFELKFGAVYDTRDFEPAPSRGTYAELMAFGSPDIIEQKDNAYLKLSAQLCKYIPLNNRLVFATRAVYQGTIAGRAPFYMQQNITTLFLRQINSEGLGGVNTIRGVFYNRLVGDGYFWSNSELRWTVFEFKFLNQNWQAGVNPFFDFGRVVQPYKLDEMKEATDNSGIYSGHSEKMHFSAGFGLKAAMNKNFVVSIECAKPFEAKDGKTGLYFGVNYIF